MCVVKAVTIISFIFICLSQITSAIYLTNYSNKNENNPAYWAEDEIWGPLMEEWALSNHRTVRVMQLPPAEGAFVADDQFDQNQSKINTGKIVSTPPKNPPGRQVSETDLYLLGAIEKLVYRVDFMEKRLRRMEEMVYYVMAGNRIDQVQCPDNFTRVGPNCYLFSSTAGREQNWKAASRHCRNLGTHLVELETIEENQDLITAIQSNQYLRGKDFWTGGLNPGLLWIWSHSARPVNVGRGAEKRAHNSTITGDGRCLRLVFDPTLKSYSYRGTDCSIRHSFVCELPENTSTNEINRIGRSKNILNEL